MVRSLCACFLFVGASISLGACGSTDASGVQATGNGAAGDGSAGSTGDGSAGDGSAGDGRVSSNASFFVTSKGSTDGGNLGGLEGADRRCQTAAERVGLGGKTWHAYLSLSADEDGRGAVNARDRIGSGPWYNVRGVLIATDVGALHEEGKSGMNGITSATGLDENGDVIPTGDPSMGIAPEHDILTGSSADGRALPRSPDYTCAGWTSNEAGPALVLPSAGDAGSSGTGGDSAVASPSSSSGGSGGTGADEAASAGSAGSAGTTGTSTPAARVGHVNREGSAVCPFCAAGTVLDPASWNSAHPTPGCAQGDLVEVGGIGRLYCFAID